MEDGKIKCINVVINSDYMKHDISTVHAFVSNLTSYVKEELPGHNKLIYFSDGAASQYIKTLETFTTINRTSDLPLSGIFPLPAMGRIPAMVQQRDW